MNTITGVKPFLRWPGGKRWLIKAGLQVPLLAPKATYWEPFLGAGSLFFALTPGRAVLSDVNEELMSAFRGLRARPGYVVTALKRLTNDRETFDRMKAWRPALQQDRAVRFIYLNRTAFSGLYRENKQGEFNVPYGDASRVICQEEVLRAAARTLKSARLSAHSFASERVKPQRGDLVYLDPPYIVGHRNNGFVRYNARLFDWSQQLALAALASQLAEEGVHVLLSAADHPAVLELYEGFWVSHFERHDQVSAKVLSRGRTTEVLIASYADSTPYSTRVRSRTR